MADLAAILELLRGLDAKHEKLAAQVRLIYLPHAPRLVPLQISGRLHVYPSINHLAQISPSHVVDTSSQVESIAAQQQRTSSIPPSPLQSGIDNIPCGPAGPWAIASPSPRGGGVEALRLASSLGTSPPPPHTPFGGTSFSSTSGPSGIALGLAAAQANGSGSGSGSRSTPVVNGTGKGVNGSSSSTNGHVHRKSDASAASGDATPAKKGLYPSRVVLTSECNKVWSWWAPPDCAFPVFCRLTPHSIPWPGWYRPRPRIVGCWP